jgi:hypothetical protein
MKPPSRIKTFFGSIALLVFGYLSYLILQNVFQPTSISAYLGFVLGGYYLLIITITILRTWGNIYSKSKTTQETAGRGYLVLNLLIWPVVLLTAFCSMAGAEGWWGLFNRDSAVTMFAAFLALLMAGIGVLFFIMAAFNSNRFK